VDAALSKLHGQVAQANVLGRAKSDRRVASKRRCRENGCVRRIEVDEVTASGRRERGSRADSRTKADESDHLATDFAALLSLLEEILSPSQIWELQVHLEYDGTRFWSGAVVVGCLSWTIQTLLTGGRRAQPRDPHSAC
jgi:hypothetical protein